MRTRSSSRQSCDVASQPPVPVGEKVHPAQSACTPWNDLFLSLALVLALCLFSVLLDLVELLQELLNVDLLPDTEGRIEQVLL